MANRPDVGKTIKKIDNKPTDCCCNTSGQEYHPKEAEKNTYMSLYIERKRTWNMYCMFVIFIQKFAQPSKTIVYK
jgi:hypothetical protein